MYIQGETLINLSYLILSYLILCRLQNQNRISKKKTVLNIHFNKTVIDFSVTFNYAQCCIGFYKVD